MSSSKVQYTEGQFIDGLRTGNNEVLNVLYKKYYNNVLKFIVNNSGTQDAAQDIYQETIIVLYENVQKPGFKLNCQLQTLYLFYCKTFMVKAIKKEQQNFFV